jgi:hypothetical protein
MPVDSFSYVTYRGERIDLGRVFATFSAYRDDPENVPSREVDRVAKLVRTAPAPDAVSSRDELVSAVIPLMFPGYGLSLLALDRPIALFAIEIPRTGEERYLAYSERHGAWRLLDEFVLAFAGRQIHRAELSNGLIKYFYTDGQIARVAEERA